MVARTAGSRFTSRTVVRTSWPRRSSSAMHQPPRKPVPPVTSMGVPGALTRASSPMRAVEPFGELDDQAFGPADVAEEERALVVDDLPDPLPAGLSAPSDDPAAVVDLEGDVPEPGTVHGGRRVFRAGGRRVEAHHLEHVAAVGAARHHDLDLRVLETDDP